jgi:hypothetical protein
MILPCDFGIQIGAKDTGATCVTVTHLPTGNRLSREVDEKESVAHTRDSLISELLGLLFEENEIRFDTGRGEDGDFIRVVHLPSGIERSAMRRDSTRELLLDAVLEELYANR